MRLSKFSAIPILMTVLTIMAFAGSSLGTLAWYAYSTTAKIEMGGTAVQSTEQLQIGLLATNYSSHTSEYAQFGAADNEFKTTLEEIGSERYIFMPAGQGFSPNAINTYLTINGCATDSLTPTTTRAFDRSSPIHDPGLKLYDSLSAGDKVNTYQARLGSYIELPLVFRVLSYDGASSSFAAEKPIWITDITSSSLDPIDRTADRALRVHVHNPDGDTDGTYKRKETDGTTTEVEHVDLRNFMINPAIHEDKDHLVDDDDEFTYVAGLLDLKKTGYYDTDSTDTEILYGDYESGTVNDTADFAADSANYADANVNGVADITASTESGTTFVAKHKEGTHGYTGFTNSSSTDLRKKATYYTLYDIAPEIDGQGDYVGGFPAAITQSNANARARIGRADLTIWLEGWDHSIIDSNIETRFNLGLTFEINRV